MANTSARRGRDTEVRKMGMIIFTLIAVVAPVLLVLGLDKGLFAFFYWVYRRRTRVKS